MCMHLFATSADKRRNCQRHHKECQGRRKADVEGSWKQVIFAFECEAGFKRY